MQSNITERGSILVIFCYYSTLFKIFGEEVSAVNITSTQLIFTCSRSTTETLEQSYKIYSQLTIKIPERRHDVVLVFSLLTYFITFSNVYFEQVNVS